MSEAGLPMFATQTVPAATPAKVGSTGPKQLMKVVLFGGSAATSVEFKNAATDTGTVLLSLNTPIGTTFEVSFEDVGGLMFPTAMFCKPAGTGGICYVWFD